MEYSYSLEDHVFNHLGAYTYRDINAYNPLNITHPLDAPYLDPISRAVNGDEDPSSINLVVPQDCAGFNLLHPPLETLTRMQLMYITCSQW